MERYSVVVGKRTSTGDAAYGSEYRECDVTVEPCYGPYLAHGPVSVGRCAEYLECVALQWFAQQVGPQPLVVEGEDVDIYSTLFEHLVVGAFLFEQRVAVAQFCEEIEVVGIGVVGLQGDVWRQLAQHGHVEVVVPWYESVVAYGSEQCAAIEEIGYVVLTTYPVKFAHHFQHFLLVCM